MLYKNSPALNSVFSFLHSPPLFLSCYLYSEQDTNTKYLPPLLTPFLARLADTKISLSFLFLDFTLVCLTLCFYFTFYGHFRFRLFISLGNGRFFFWKGLFIYLANEGSFSSVGISSIIKQHRNLFGRGKQSSNFILDLVVRQMLKANLI